MTETAHEILGRRGTLIKLNLGWALHLSIRTQLCQVHLYFVCLQSSTDVSPSATPSSTPLVGTHAPKFGTVIPSRIFVGGIAANVSTVDASWYECIGDKKNGY